MTSRRNRRWPWNRESCDATAEKDDFMSKEPTVTRAMAAKKLLLRLGHAKDKRIGTWTQLTYSPRDRDSGAQTRAVSSYNAASCTGEDDQGEYRTILQPDNKAIARLEQPAMLSTS